MSALQPSMAWRNSGRLSATFHTARNPSDDEWEQYLSDTHKLGDLSGRKILVVSLGGGPSGKQRHRLVATLGEQQAPVAIVSSSALFRGIGTAIGWFNRLLKTFSPDEMDAAYAYLELTAAERQRAQELLAEMREELGVSQVKATSSGG